MSYELKPCPYCGGDSIAFNDEGRTTGPNRPHLVEFGSYSCTVISCSSKGPIVSAPFEALKPDRLAEVAASAWNRRASDV